MHDRRPATRRWWPLLITLASTLTAGRPELCSAAPAGQGDDAVLLEESMEIDIASLTSARVRYRNRTQVLTQRGVERYDSAAISYTPGVAIREFRGGVVSTAGKRVEVRKQQISDGAAFASFELYADNMVRVMSFQGAAPGSILEYEYEQEVRNLFYLPDSFDLQEGIPVRLKTLSVRTPANFPIRVQIHGATPEQTRSEKDGFVTQSWTVRDVSALRAESRMPPAEDLVPHISISPKTILWGSHTLDASSWSGVALFYWELAKDRMTPTPEVADMARTLTSAVTAPDDKVRALFEFAQGKINYVSISLGIGGWQPHASGDVMRHRYGDCKDKATLLVAMLKALGLVGYPVLIHTRDDGLIDRDNPGLYFNHAIVAIPQEHGYLFLDPTDKTTPFGDLPWPDQGVPVLVVKEGGVGDFTETPLMPPERNRRNRLIAASIAAGGALEGTYLIETWGQRRVEMTSLLDGGPNEREDLLEDLIAWLCPGAVMKSHEITPPKKPGDPMSVKIQFQVPGFVNQAGAMQIVSPHLARLPGLTEISAYPTRLHPVFFSFLGTETSEVRLQLPPGKTLKRLPADRSLNGPGLASRTHYESIRKDDRNTLVVNRSVTISRREIPPADYPQLRAFLSALGEEEAGAVTLVPEG